MSRATRWAIPISMITARGARLRTMVRFGIRTMSHPAGLPTVRAAGTMSARGAGLGLAMSLGALLRIITDAGIILAGAGVGTLVCTAAIPSMAPRLSASSAVALASVLAGSRWDLANRSIPGLAAG